MIVFRIALKGGNSTFDVIIRWFNANLHAVTILLNQAVTACLRIVVFKNNVTFNFELAQLLSSRD